MNLSINISIQGEIDLIGSVIISETPLEIQSRSGVFLLENLVLPEPAAILKFKTYVVGPEGIWFQLWRPASMGRKRYSLVTQIRFATERYPEITNVSILSVHVECRRDTSLKNKETKYIAYVLVVYITSISSINTGVYLMESPRKLYVY